MACKVYGALIASLGVAALMVGSNETFARSGSAPGVGARGGFASTHPIFRPLGRLHRNVRRNDLGAVWPVIGDSFYYAPPNGEAIADFTQPISSDVYGIPWDWAHRYPPMVIPSERPYVTSCPAETVTVPGRYGNEQTINIIRCY